MKIDLLYEPVGLPAFDLPAALSALYPGSIGLAEDAVYANFVATTDGVVAVPSLPQSNKLIADGSAADRFVMGLLRAAADAVVLGSGTLAASPRGLWTPSQAYPDAAAGFDELRTLLGLSGSPEVAILSASGSVDPAHPVFEAGGVVITTDAGATRLAGGVETVSIGAALDPIRVLAALRARGHRRILHEGGPHTIGPFFAAGAVDELFLTISPLLIGRSSADTRLGLVEGSDLLPANVRERLIGIRRDSDHVFLRYAIIRS